MRRQSAGGGANQPLCLPCHPPPPPRALLQVNLDFESETDMIEKTRIGMALQVGGAAGWQAQRLQRLHAG